MYGPSGFFADIPEDDSIVSGDLELFRDSPEGFTVLYRCQRSGRFFIYKALKPGYRGLRIYEDMLRKDFEIVFPYSIRMSASISLSSTILLPAIAS